MLRQEEKPDQYFLSSWHATVDSLSPSELLTLVINRWGLESFQFTPGMLSKVYLKFLNFILYYIPEGPVKNLHLLITDSKVGNHQLRMNTFCLTKRWSQNSLQICLWCWYCWLVIHLPVNLGSKVSANSFLGSLLLSCFVSSRFGSHPLLV